MYKNILLVLIVVVFGACGDNKISKNLDGKKLLNQKCSSCHNLDLPPVISKDELAPPMMAVAFHVHSFVKPTDESQRDAKAVEFVVDYVEEPALEKSFCDKESLKRYGLMPSQKENVTKNELKAIAKFMFLNYTQENLAKMQKAQKEYDALSSGEKIALKYKCLGCHKIDKKIVGPSFKNISKKFANSKENILKSIKNGSKNSWKDSKGAVMPAFKNISKDELNTLSNWILNI